MLNNAVDLKSVKNFCSQTGITLIKCRNSGTRLSINVGSANDYRNLIKFLKLKKVSFHHYTLEEDKFHHYTLEEDKPLKVIIRGWPVAIDHAEALEALRAEGFSF